MADKKYINGMIIKTVGEYNDLAVSIKVDEFISELKSIANGQWANILIKKRREPSSKGITHFVVDNTFVPKGNTSYEDEVF